MKSVRDPKTFSTKELEDIWHEVPVDYYQNGTKRNFLQRLWHHGKLNTVLSLTNPTHKKILDVGCASGWFLSNIKRKFPNAQCYGIDVYQDAVSYGKKIYPFLHLVKADAHKLPFKSNTFDLIVNTEVLEHVVDPEKALREMYRVLAPGGVMIVEMDTGNLAFQTVWHWWTHMRRGVWKDAHIQIFNAQRLENMIRQVGLKIKQKKYFNSTMAVAFRIEKSG